MGGSKDEGRWQRTIIYKLSVDTGPVVQSFPCFQRDQLRRLKPPRKKMYFGLDTVEDK